MTSFNAKYQQTSKTANALFGGSNVSVKSPSNTENPEGFASVFYNHAVVLLTDENGTDESYSSNQNDNLGYVSRFENTNTSGENLKDAITNALRSFVNFEPGHKLNPYSLSTAEDGYQIIKSDPYTFNGRSYYIVGNETFNSKITNNAEISELRNIAIFGDRSYVKFDNSASHFREGTHGLFDYMNGYSSISGMAIDANIIYDNIATGNYGILVGQMFEHSIVYAINVRGTLDVGGNEAPSSVSGLVGELTSGHIYDVSTDLDIRYRAKEGGKVYGLTSLKTDNSDYQRIEDSFTGGSIQTLISANVTAFANFHGSTSIENCYAYPKLDIRDYTNATNTSSGTVTVFNTDVKDKNLFYDINGLNYEDIKNTVGDQQRSFAYLRREEGSDIKYFSIDDRWTNNYNFNYGYPTLRYQYLNVSSYAILTRSIKKSDRLAEDDGAARLISPDPLQTDDEYYDKYITENTYTRLENGDVPYSDTTKKYYFMIPNVSLLIRMNDVHKTENNTPDGLTKNFILKNDIDFIKLMIENAKTSIHSAPLSGGRDFKGIFDGQNKTIKNMGKEFSGDNEGKESLFTSISGSPTDKARVMNLRLTDVDSKQYSVLARDRIENAEISNIMLSGNFEIKSNESAGESAGESADGAEESAEVQMIVGGLAPKAIKTSLYAITNAIQINVKGESTYTMTDDNKVNYAVVGGIVGELQQNSTMKYCSNYGPINAATKDVATDGEVIIAGGLVGVATSGTTISYSYNSTSVLSNYASTIDGTKTCSTKGRFYAGGLVGYTMEYATIEYSYNSGMIKAGNKSNNDAAYAAGITAYIKSGGLIDNCYNEGAIEALGENPATEWRFIDNKFVLKQTQAKRNVYAYGIAYAAAKTADIVSCKIIAPNNEETTLYDIINNNGVVMDGDNSTIIEIPWTNIRSSATGGWNYDFNGLGVKQQDTSFSSNDGVYQAISFDISRKHTEVVSTIIVTTPVWSTYKSDIKYLVGRSITKPNSEELSKFTYDGKIKGIYDMQFSTLGLPRSVVIPVQNKLTIQKYEFSWLTYSSALWGAGFSPSQRPINGKTIATYYAYDYFSKNTNEFTQDKDIDTYYKFKGLNFNNHNLIGSSLGSGNAIENAATHIDELKFKTRSLETLDETDLETYTLTIEGNNYYLADGDNFNKLFNAGTFIASSSITSKDLPYVPNIKYYSIIVKKGDKTCQASVTGVSTDGIGNTTVSFQVYSEKEIEGQYDINVKLNYNETVQLSVTNLKFYRVQDDDYSLGVKLPIKGERLKGYSLTTQEGTKYDNVVKVSKKQYEYEDLNSHKYIYEPSDEAENDFIYLAYKELKTNGDDTEYIYIPNALLQIPGGTIKRVNLQEILVTTEEDGNDEYLPLKPSTKGQIKEINEDPAVSKEEKDKALSDKEKDEAFAKNVKALTDAIANSLQSKSVEQQDVKILYNRVREGTSVTRSLSSHMTQLYSVNKEIQSGSDELPTQFSNQVGEVRGFVDTLGGISNQGSNTFYSSNILPASGNLVAVSGEEVIFAQSGDRLVTNDEGKITINGYTATISLTSDRKLKIEVDRSGLGQTLINYFTNLKYYYNETLDTRSSEKKVYDYLNQDEMEKKGIYDVNNAGKLTYEKRVYIEDEEGNKDYGFIYAGIEIKGVSQTVKPKEYKLGDIIVKYGTETISWKNYLQYVPSTDQGTSVNKGTIGFNTGYGAKMLVDNTSNTQESIDIVYKAIVKINDSEQQTSRRIADGSGGRVDLNLTLSNEDISNPITKLYLELNALPTYKIGSAAKEESYDYKFLIKDPAQNAYYQVELKDFDEKTLPLSSSEDTTITLDEISSVTMFHLNGNNIVDYYIKVSYYERTEEAIYDDSIDPPYSRPETTTKTYTYSINLLNGDGEQIFYEYSFENNDFSGKLYFDAQGQHIKGRVVSNELTLSTGGTLKIADPQKSTGSYVEDDDGYLIFEDTNLNGQYYIGGTNSYEINLKGGKYTCENQDKIVDKNGNEVGTLKINDSGQYIVLFKSANLNGERSLQMRGANQYNDLSSYSDIYGPTGIKFEHGVNDPAIKGLNINSFDKIFKLSMQQHSNGIIYYVYLDSIKYDMVLSLEAENNEIYESQATIPQFTYESFDWVQYKPIDINFSENVSLSKYDENGMRLDEINLFSDNEFLASNKAEFCRKQDGNYQIFLTESNYKGYIYARAKLAVKLEDKGELSAGKPLAAGDIILTKDISFSNLIGINIDGVKVQHIIKNSSTNIIGNGYFISYFGDSLFNRVRTDPDAEKWIRETNFLGDTRESTSMLVAESNITDGGTASIVNCNIYGTFVNNFADDTSGNTPVIAQSSSNLKFSNFNTYVSVNTLYKITKADRLKLFDTTNDKLSDITNYGVIDLEDGAHGDTAGSKGSAGMGLSYYNDSSAQGSTTCKNNGIVKLGIGGNGGAGGETNRTAVGTTTGIQPANNGQSGNIWDNDDEGIKLYEPKNSLVGPVSRLEFNPGYTLLQEKNSGSFWSYHSTLFGGEIDWFLRSNEIKVEYSKIQAPDTKMSIEAVKTEGEQADAAYPIVINKNGGFSKFDLKSVFDAVYDLQGAGADFVPPTEKQ